MARERFHPGIIFLSLISVVILGVIGFFVWLNANEQMALQIAFVPKTLIADETMPAEPNYENDDAWAARPDLPSTANLLPEGLVQTAQIREVDVFYIHPTTAIPGALDDKRWNAATDDERVLRLNDAFALRHQASAFTLAGEVFAPRYRQATIGAFFDTSGQGAEAIQRAYVDVIKAFDFYIERLNDGRPFILAGHSQGSLHGLMLLRDRIASSEIRDQLVASYLIGWPLSIEADLAPLNLVPCRAENDTGCVISFQSFAEGGNPSTLLAAFSAIPGVTGDPRPNTTMLCTNPLTWVVGGAAGSNANLGAVARKQTDGQPAAPIPRLTGARCGEDGILYLTDPPAGDWRANLLPGENYHAVDYNLFWSNIRENAAQRARIFIERTGKTADTPPAGVGR